MTIAELIERLEEYREELGEEIEVRLMTQSNWPLENTVFGLTSGQEINDSVDDGDDVEADRVVYICEGTQLGYGTKRAWEVAH